MENYIIIIIAAIVLVIRAIETGKRKATPQPQNGKPAVPNNLLEMIKELGVQPPAPQPVESIIESEIIKTPEENYMYEFTANEEGGSMFKSSNLKSNAEEKKAAKSNTVKNERFSLKKAVIYSEILNRKYI